ncbi:MAG: hypothetical protein ACJASR_000126 [Psychroserpens sp.]|jgi:hypothetical protein
MTKKVELKLDIKHVTRKAILVINLNNQETWLPISQIEIEGDRFFAGVREITIPEWIAIKNELV